MFSFQLCVSLVYLLRARVLVDSGGDGKVLLFWLKWLGFECSVLKGFVLRCQIWFFADLRSVEISNSKDGEMSEL
ncbi:unnamed protein product [Arabis nemorensis]|uniref:Uncharacterized protein n=1 Tax=Arabis nemorensis TaxID=586526 RepID=A0A565ATC3_9BRAS|nr:unnamed protein product [Arabis nemorensis]